MIVQLGTGILLGTSFSNLVNSLIKDVLMPPILLIFSNASQIRDLFIVLHGKSFYKTLADAQADGANTLNFGLFMEFMLFKRMNNMVKCRYCMASIDQSARKCRFCTEKIEHINLKVVGPDGGEVAFKIKKSTNLQKLMEAYATKTGQRAADMRFLYDGSRVNGTDSPESLEMEDGDQMTVAIEQQGGFFNY